MTTQGGSGIMNTCRAPVITGIGGQALAANLGIAPRRPLANQQHPSLSRLKACAVSASQQILARSSGGAFHAPPTPPRADHSPALTLPLDAATPSTRVAPCLCLVVMSRCQVLFPKVSCF